MKRVSVVIVDLYRRRMLFHLTIEDIAHLSGVSKARYSQIETCQVDPTDVELRQICKVLNIEYFSLEGIEYDKSVRNVGGTVNEEKALIQQQERG
ncbi:helix-turn-helix domain-containing protein [Enterococcus canis]|uniref:helix-turn-helix domain-containing protein n=1 Tax=Enterococcus canis TaxID=214095 RepID=UPI0009E944F4|nr:helix-turn-helix transcriptional regulator [Enterococcus canis]